MFSTLNNLRMVDIPLKQPIKYYGDIVLHWDKLSIYQHFVKVNKKMINFSEDESIT